MNKGIPISVAIITHNEELNIGDALASVSEFGDIVVVDSFSSDKTLDIARKYTERIYQHEWQGFARQKQTAVDYARNEWVLVLDADERVPPDLKKEIQAAILALGNDGFLIPRKNFFLGKWIRHGGWWPDEVLRLFRKKSGAFDLREVHEKVVVKGVVRTLAEPLEHYSYRSLSEYIKKMESYATLSAKTYIRENRRPSLKSLIVNPASTFIKMYILRRGFLDGVHGFLLAVLYSFQTFLKYAKLWEMCAVGKNKENV
ncbi:MAG TPA: glycosyltransferase family 2 protein [Dissulfurispiraceae bacterium]|nr:glycosyltransferase family 2 protein [Dissulfurispiraceae bacterium]